MLFETLDPSTQINGLFGFIALPISLIMGISIFYKYFKLKDKILLIFAFAIMFTNSPWYPSQIGYIIWLITQEIITFRTYVLMGTVAVPIAILSWLYIYLTTIKPEKLKIVMYAYLIFSIIFYIYLFTFLYLPGANTDVLIGEVEKPLDVNYRGFVFIYLSIAAISSMITGLHFSIKSTKEQSILVKWKGKILLLSFLLFGIGAFGDVIETLILFRILLVIAQILFYLGFMMPNFMKKILKIEE
ncbi:MAG: hypothetical protein ACTSRH_10750 [Promethearchaeota archaeon]